ncbi:hypothetical protein F5Y16DRAFT_419598 [Xylariaceae sp. FL0255]|nr:hypothetical protein F5Y16DRAFT_419598 [Xylariaceae sp. FL0255]
MDPSIPRTLFQSFTDTPLPAYLDPSGPPAQTSSSSSSSLIPQPIPFPLPTTRYPSSHYIQLGLATVNQGIMRLSLSNEYVYLREHTMVHLTGRDVLLAATLHLLHPIHQAFSFLPSSHFPDQTQSSSEDSTWRGYSSMLYQRVPSLPRTDLDRPFALLWFLPHGHIVKREFTDAMDYSRTFRGRSATLMRDVAADSAIKHRVQYIGLFNWDFMVLIKFPRLNLDPKLTLKQRRDNGVGDSCQIAMLEYDKESHHMRAALLGFLMEAYRDCPPVQQSH